MTGKQSSLEKGFRSLQHFLAKLEIGIATIAFSLMMVDVIAGIIMRKFLKLPFPWGEEMARYLMITGILAGLGICARNRVHMKVDIFVSLLPKLPQRILNIFSDLVTLGCYIFLVILTVLFIQANSTLGQVSASLKIPIYYVYYILLVGFSLALIEHIILLIQDYILKPRAAKEAD